jgi:2-keto-4-pentenoate hydratase/2-oxohepta-3-ene-1,7-dioic acid hydratase in catechol pathway
MLLCRYERGGRISHGIVDGDKVTPIADIFGDQKPAGDAVPLSSVRLFAPVEPSKILAAAVNYQSHVPSGSSVLKSDDGAPKIPQLFLKPSSSLIGPDDTINLPAEARRVDAEGEVVAVIGRICRKVSEAEALDYVLGYTAGNDVSARHWQRDDIQWWRAKGSDTFSPLGPYIVTGLDAANINVTTRVNGVETQSGNTRDLIHSIAAMIAFASQVMTLEAGDVLYTGTPGVPPKLEDGDVVEVEIDAGCLLRNAVKREA